MDGGEPLALTSSLVLRGHYELQILRGAVSIGGITLQASEDIVPVSCPTSPFFTIKPRISTSSLDLVPQHLLSRFENVACIITVTHLQVSHMPALAPQYQSLFDPLQQLSAETDPAQLWTPFNSWTSLSHLDKQQRLVIAGPKNSGKSSLARYIANSLKDMYLLDLDPGQCEYTPPGTLSLVKINGANWSAPYMHKRGKNTIIKAQSLGYVSPVECPGRYLDICRQLYQLYPQEGVLVVNTPGWTKGLGLELVVEIMCIVQATKVVHLGHDEFFDDLQESVLDRLGLIVDVCDAIEKDQQTPAKFSSSDIRNVSTLCYFHNHDSRHITEWPPYEIPIEPESIDGSAIAALALLDADGIDPNDIGDLCFEGTIVAIVECADPIRVNTNFKTPCIMSEGIPDLYENGKCIGYGVVQKIIGSVVRLITPLDPSTINGQIILVRGRLEMPLYLAWNQKTANSPWLISKNPPGVGSVYTKFRRNIARG